MCGHAQEDAGQPKEQAVSQTGLLPVYGVDLNFDAAWVDGAKFPSESAEHPGGGVNATFQQVWEALKPSGFNIVRVPIDIRDMPGAANRLATLCVWAKANNVSLIPVLLGAERGHGRCLEPPGSLHPVSGKDCKPSSGLLRPRARRRLSGR